MASSRPAGSRTRASPQEKVTRTRPTRNGVSPAIDAGARRAYPPAGAVIAAAAASKPALKRCDSAAVGTALKAWIAPA